MKHNPRPNTFIRHIHFMDVMIEVKKCYDYGHGVKIVGVWWNKGQTSPYCLNIKAKLNIGKHSKDKKRPTVLEDWEVVPSEIVYR